MPPRRAQPLFLLSRSNPPLRGGVKIKNNIIKLLQKQVRLLKDFINKDLKQFISKTRL